MIITPFAFMASQAPSWTPYDFANITHYWRSDSGITLSGTDVQTWTDVLSSLALNVWSTATYPAYNATDASYNNKPTIEFNGTSDALGASATSGYLATDSMTILVIHAPVKTGASQYQMLAGDSIGFMEMMMNSSLPGAADILGAYKFNMGGSNGVVSTGLSYTSGDLIWQGAAIDHATTTFYQWVNSGTPVSSIGGQGASATKDPFHPVVGSYGAPGAGIGLYYPGKIMEFMFIKGVPSPTEFSDFNTYVNTFV